MALTTTEKIMILGALGVAGYLAYVHFSNPAGTVSLPSGSTAAPTANPNDVATVTAWISSFPDADNKASGLAQIPNMTADELSQIAYIITNYWNTGVQPSSAQIAFATNWEEKYSIVP